MDFPTHSEDLAMIESFVRKAARKLKRSPIFVQETEDDLFQDLYVHVLEAWSNYDAQKGTMSQFTHCVLKHASLNLMRRYCRPKRPHPFRQVPLNDDLLEDENYQKEFEQRTLSWDVQKRLRRLPLRTREFAEKLKEKSPSTLKKELGLTRQQFNRLKRQSQICLRNATDFLVPQRGRSICTFR
ncbi:hypothetical protein AGMMS49949_05680 [Alphaproteobacteria bacterium]|nr:hypothetical protein AGMMS49949_05680 [Alphaproteobacteria bacterium]